MKRLWLALLYSISGFKIAAKEEMAFKQEIFLALILIPLAFFLASDKFSLILMIGSIILVLICELVNTAIEAAIDFTSDQIHPLAKKAKDTASAAVLLAIIQAILVWILLI